MARTIRCFDYINCPYQKAREILSSNSSSIFRNATFSAADRVNDLAADLKVQVAGFDIGKEVTIHLKEVEVKDAKATAGAKTVLHLEWSASKLQMLFPFMAAELSLYPLTSTESQLEFSGKYEVPLGYVGKAIDAVAGHRFAEASVHRFIGDIAAYLRAEIGENAR